MARALGLAVVAGCALGALALLVQRSGSADHPAGLRAVSGLEADAVLAPSVPASPPRERADPGATTPPPLRVAVVDPLAGDSRSSADRGGLVVEGELLADRHDEAQGEWVREARRSSGRVRYMPIGDLDGRTLIEQELVDVERFTSEPLPAGEWIVETRVPGFQPDVEWVRTLYEDYDYVASLRPGVELEFDVRLPDGSQPERALFAFALRDPEETRRAFVPRSDEVLAHPTCLWTPAAPRVCVSLEDRGNATDLIFVAEPTAESPYDARAPSRYVSSAITVDRHANTPIRVQLREASSLRIALARPVPPVLELRHWVRGVRLDACDGFDVDVLGASSADVWDWPPALLERAEFEWFESSNRWDEAESLTAWYLLPGRWHVAAGWRGQPASTTRVVEVVPGLVDVALTLGQPETSQWIRARFVVDGELVEEPRIDLSFAIAAAGPTRATRGVGGSSVRGAGGRWFERSDVLGARQELTEALHADVPAHLVAWDRRSGGRRHAFVSGPLGDLAGELVLEEVARVGLVLQVAHASKRRIRLALHPRLIEPSPATLLAQSALPHRIDPASINFGLAPRAHEYEVLGEMMPGRWRFEVHVSSAPLVRLEPIEAQLDAGRQTLQLSLPELFDVTVHAPTLQAGTRVALGLRESSATGTPEGARVSERLSATQRVVFQDVPAGHYVLTHGTTFEPFHIVVPCGEVLFEPRRADAFEVRITPLDDGGRGALARAGFESGDVLLEFDGRGLGTQVDLDALLETCVQREARVHVRRGAGTLELRLGPMPDPSDPWATFDAEFLPAWR